MSASELQSLEKSIHRFQVQLAGKRDALTTIEKSEQARIKLQIDDLRAEIHELEQEKWELIAMMSQDIPVEEAEAETLIAEIVEQEQAIINNPPAELSSEMVALLQEILVKLDQPDTNASAKLKGAISTFPPFVGLTYEAELDTEKTLRRYLPTFYRWGQQIVERLKK